MNRFSKLKLEISNLSVLEKPKNWTFFLSMKFETNFEWVEFKKDWDFKNEDFWKRGGALNGRSFPPKQNVAIFFFIDFFFLNHCFQDPIGRIRNSRDPKSSRFLWGWVYFLCGKNRENLDSRTFRIAKN